MDWKDKLQALVEDFLKDNGEDSPKQLQNLLADVGLPQVVLPKDLSPESVLDVILGAIPSTYQADQLESLLNQYPDPEALREDFTLRGVLEETVYQTEP